MKSEQFAHRNESGIAIRVAPLRVAWRLSSLPTSDNHLLDLKFSCSVRAIDNPTERAMLAETFLTRSEAANVDDVIKHFHDALRTAAARFASELPVSDALATDFQTPLKAAADVVAFSCGLEVVAPIEALVESPTLQRQKLESLERQLAEQPAAGQVEHFQRSRELLKEFQSMRDAEPGFSPSRILQSISEVDRGAMLQTLLIAGSGKEQASLWAVSGESLVRIDPRVSPPKVQTIALPDVLGPLRSVCAVEDHLLIGARGGVFVTDRDGSNVQTHKAPQTTSSMGFNSVAIAHGTIWASHSELGVVAWRLGESEAFRTHEQAGARNIVGLDDTRAIYSVGGEVWVIDGDGERVVEEVKGSTIVELLKEGSGDFVCREDGIVQQLDRESLRVVREHRPASSICAAGALPWFGDMRLLIAPLDGQIFCCGVEDSLITQYASAHRGFKAISATSDCIAALSGDRQRIVIWQSWNPVKPQAEIHLAGVTRHRVADLAFG